MLYGIENPYLTPKKSTFEKKIFWSDSRGTIIGLYPRLVYKGATASGHCPKTRDRHGEVTLKRTQYQSEYITDQVVTEAWMVDMYALPVSGQMRQLSNPWRTRRRPKAAGYKSLKIYLG